MTVAEAMAKLQEIPPPAAVSYLPQTWGWLVLLALPLLALTVKLWRVYRRWRAERYRREAFAELAALMRRLDDPGQRAPALAALPALIKRTALGFAPRRRVAALSGDDWLDFLDASLPTDVARAASAGKNPPPNDDRAPFRRGPGRLLWACAYRDAADLNALPRADIDALCALLKRWIDHHVPI